MCRFILFDEAAILQLLGGLAVSPRAAIELVQEIRDSKNDHGIWETALTILLDHEESSIVRENAATLLGNITSHTMPSSANTVIIIANLTPSSMKKSNNVIIAILNLLDDYKFYKELKVVLSNLFIKTIINFKNDEDKYNSEEKFSSVPSDYGEYAYAYRRYISPDNKAHSASIKTTDSDAINFTMVVTPALIKAISIFVHNLLVLAEEHVTNALQEYGLIKMFFRAKIAKDKIFTMTSISKAPP